MTGPEPLNGGLRGYLDVLSRRRWLILQAAVLVPVAALVVSYFQTPQYAATAKVFLSRQDLSSSLNGIQDPAILQDSTEFLATQAELARTPAVAGNALDLAGHPNRPAKDLLDASSVAPAGDSDVLEFRVTDGSPGTAEALATAYAQSFANYRLKLDTSSLSRARAQVEARMARLRRAGEGQSGLYETLANREEQLGTMEALQTSHATPLGEAPQAVQVQPRPVRNALLGLVLGLAVGIGIAFLRNALDTSVRSAEEIDETLGAPMLGRLPAPPAHLGDRTLVMLASPEGPEAEGFRMLRMNVEFANLTRSAKTLLVTSALEREGKSTTAANLAVALALDGKKVALVDLDLRRPMLANFFDISPTPGLTDAALGRVRISQAVASRHVAPGSDGGPSPGAHNGTAELEAARVDVLPRGSAAPNPGELVGSAAVSEVLKELEARYDLVIVDSPPFLQISDPLVLMGAVDGVILVVRLESLRRPVLREIARTLETSRANLLGYVLTSAAPAAGYTYSYTHDASDGDPTGDGGVDEGRLARLVRGRAGTR